MAYVTVQELVDHFGKRELVQLSNPDAPRAEEVDEARVQRVLDEASAELDSWIGLRRPTPVSPAPLVLKGYAADVAIYKLTTLRSKGGTEDARKRYEDAIRWARAYARGEASLGFPEPVDDSGAGLEFAGPERIFTRGTLFS